MSCILLSPNGFAKKVVRAEFELNCENVFFFPKLLSKSSCIEFLRLRRPASRVRSQPLGDTHLSYIVVILCCR